jgi:hypothetical protein
VTDAGSHPRRGVTLKGLVADQGGNPAIGVPVDILALDRNEWRPYKATKTGSDGYFTVMVKPTPNVVAFKPVIQEYADIKLVGNDFPINRISNALSRNLSGRMKLAFQNSGNVMTTLLPINWEIEHVPGLRTSLYYPSQKERNLAPNELIYLEPEITLESEKYIADVLESHSGTETVTIKYTFTAPGGNQVTKEGRVRVLLTS